ncbi:hypothetical protein Cgig2_023870 [Carnegiea gigantea]|uniref:Uncharacterized protein n=1 Tax=Carnegiea gigantea TaxID=171969 RepID=A0A9Q1GKQ2_9CARY|nr:hypothetical protein Cgig2_023870 [Carnegiea gigantea]
MGFTSFLKVDLKQIPRKFPKWLVESFDPYAVCFRLSDGQKFPVIAFDVYATLDVPLGRREIIEITESSMDEEYHEVPATWLKEWKVQKNAPELTRMPEFILAKKDEGKSFKRNFIIYLVNCFFSGPKNRYCNKFILKYVKDVSVIVEKEDFHEDVVLDHPKSVTKKDDSIPSCGLGLGLSQSDSQSSVPHTTSVPDLSTAVVNEDDGGEDDDVGAQLRFLLSNTSQVYRELRIKKPAENKPKEGDEPSCKKKAVDQKKGSPGAYSEQEATDSRKPKLIKEVLLKKDNENCVGAARTPEKSEEVGPLDAPRKQSPQNLPLAYSSLKPLFDGYRDKEATRVSMATLRLGEEVEMNVINIWSSIPNDRERKGSRHS